MVKDYKDFIEAKDQNPPNELDALILGNIRKNMNPSSKIILLKLITIQAFISTLTLLFCPQFNFSLTNSYAIFHTIHSTFGHHLCMIVCGSIFLGSGALFAGIILNRYELKTIGHSHPLYFTAATGLAVSIFLFFGANLYLDMAALWASGAIISSVLLFEIGKFLKLHFAH